MLVGFQVVGSQPKNTLPSLIVTDQIDYIPLHIHTNIMSGKEPTTESTTSPALGSTSNDTSSAAAAAAAAGSTQKAVIKSVDMSDEMQQWTVDIAQEALKQFSVEKDIAAHIKRQMDKKCGPTWHVVAGQHCEYRFGAVAAV